MYYMQEPFHDMNLHCLCLDFFSCNKIHDRSQVVIYQLLQNMGVVHWSLFIRQMNSLLPH
jgi:hypothetical protein